MPFINSYHSLARFIVSDKDRSPAIYRRFDYLAARRLLWLQSELQELEAQLRAFDGEDEKAPLDQKAIASDWAKAVARTKDGNDQYAKKRVDLAKEIGEKLTEYRQCAIEEHQFRAIERPAARPLEAARNTFFNVGSSGIPALRGKNEIIFNDRHDLMSLRVPTEDDRLTRYLQEYLPILFRKRVSNTEDKLMYFSERRLHAFVVIVYIILAVLLLFGAIFNLYYVQDMQKRLGIIAAYTSVFALCVGFLTNARRAEVFGACAAYAAVLVVFVSGGLGCDCQQPTG